MTTWATRPKCSLGTVSKNEAGGGGCDNCCAMTLGHRFGTGWTGAPMRKIGLRFWNEPVRWNRRAAVSGNRPKVFPSMCDPLDKATVWLAIHRHGTRSLIGGSRS